MFHSYRSEDEEDELEDEEEDDGSSVEEVEDEGPVHAQGLQSSEHREHQVSGVELGAVAGGESVPAYSQPAKGSSVEIGSNGYAVSVRQSGSVKSHAKKDHQTAREEARRSS